MVAPLYEAVLRTEDVARAFKASVQLVGPTPVLDGSRETESDSIPRQMGEARLNRGWTWVCLTCESGTFPRLIPNLEFGGTYPRGRRLVVRGEV